MQKLAQGQGTVLVYYPSGPLIQYSPDKVSDPPGSPRELLAWAKENPKKFQYADPANSGPGRTFLMGLPYLLGDEDPKDPKSWDKTWKYLKELDQYIGNYASGTTETMQNLADGQVVLEVAGVSLPGTGREGLAGGARAVAAIRPEDLDVAPEASAADDPPGSGRIPVTVEVVEYHGRELAVEARLPDGQEVHFRTGGRLAPGDSVELTVPAGRVLVFTPDGGGHGGHGSGLPAPAAAHPEPSPAAAGEAADATEAADGPDGADAAKKAGRR